MSHPLLSRPHLEALLLGRTLLDPGFAAGAAPEHLSPAARTLLVAVASYPALAAGGGLLAAARPSGDPEQDGYVVRLAHRVERLSLLELTLFSGETLLALVNRLPRISAARAA